MTWSNSSDWSSSGKEILLPGPDMQSSGRSLAAGDLGCHQGLRRCERSLWICATESFLPYDKGEGTREEIAQRYRVFLGMVKKAPATAPAHWRAVNSLG